MANILVASFRREAQAVEASHKLTELESYGNITVYEMVMVRKDQDGKVAELQAEGQEGLHTLSGMAIGVLIGALAGPVGMAVGMFTGTLTGAALELDHYSFTSEFGSRVINKMEPGTVAIIAEVEEDNEAYIDSTLMPLGASLIRSDVDYEYDKFDDQEIEAIDEEIADERAKIRLATTEEKAKILSGIAALKEKRRAKISKLEDRAKTAVSETRSRLQALGQDVSNHFRDLKIARLKNKIEKHKARLAELEAELEHAM
jgi:uncharacterized membrane protein